ncbi:ubiquinol-cytochrome c reductase iron-sulfur subunit [Paenibacillus chartarius]|uniref:Ubiquinol-cytochrome c reductase iron-sulfur subunit n=1 Tax=Paenibacillus chartarius TaxID=747481 RepID=A0ABV6DQB2_9BACL
MSDHNNQAGHHKAKPVKQPMSRRQFLSYTLGGAGGFMAAGIVIPMLRFAVDPMLQPAAKADWIKVVEESKISTEPKAFQFKMHQVDGWYESDVDLTAWIAKDSKGQVFALNPTCKHLGCTVNFEAAAHEYLCPCHGAKYTVDGKNLSVAPLPLDEYTVKVEQGFVYVGQLHANSRA